MKKGLVLLFLALPLSTIAFKIISKKRKKMPENKIFTENEAKRVFSLIASMYGADVARNTEKIFRLETNHFRSTQFKNTYGAGMLAFGKSLPYGWTRFKELWKNNPELAPTGVWSVWVWVDPKTGAGKFVAPNTPNSKIYNYLVFPSFEASALTVANYVRKNSPEAWTSNDIKEKISYKTKLNTINARYV